MRACPFERVLRTVSMIIAVCYRQQQQQQQQASLRLYQQGCELLLATSLDVVTSYTSCAAFARYCCCVYLCNTRSSHCSMHSATMLSEMPRCPEGGTAALAGASNAAYRDSCASEIRVWGTAHRA